MLFRQHDFKNIAEFKEAILKEDSIFVTAFVKHLLAYSLGRQLTPWDRIHVDNIVASAAADGYRIQDVIEKLVLSKPFRSQ